MAEIQDFDKDEIGELEAVEQQTAEKTVEQEEDDLDPKYRGKSAKEIAQMHQEAEKLIARQAQEVGETRRLADELIKSQLKPKPEEEKPEVDFFENPAEAVRKAVENNPKVLQAEQYAQASMQQMARQQLLNRHPDALELTQNEDFRKWIGDSKVRTKLLVESSNNYDVDTADELISTYKALKGVKEKQVSEADKLSRENTLRSASVDTSGSGESSKKVYRRADLIQLKMRDPAKFDSMQDEIDRAYAEGRVRN